jgi:16S rRNA (cytosine967-C5)-methyltransferase
VFYEGAFSNILLNEVSNDPEVDQHAKNFIFALTLGTINQKIYLEYVANKFFDQKKAPNEIQVLIWLSIYQLKFMDKVPAYAIVNEAVELAKTLNKKFAGFVNGMLKTLISKGDEAYFVDLEDEDAKFALENSFPIEIYRQLLIDYGEEHAKAFVLNSNKIPDIDIRINTLKIGTRNFYEKFQHRFSASKIDDLRDGLTVKRVVVKSSIYRDGLVTVQDKASILVGQILNPKMNSRVLDMCAAPGGKLTHLAAIMRNTGYIKAYEKNESRIGLIQENIDRLNVKNVELVNDDARNAISDEPYDYVLLDAPCSGLGVIKRKPEIKLNITFRDNESLYQTQSELLETAYNVLKYQGQLVYSTCTLHRSENEGQIENFLVNHPNMKVV